MENDVRSEGEKGLRFQNEDRVRECAANGAVITIEAMAAVRVR